MGRQATGDVTEFIAAAGAFLRAQRARNTIFLTVTETIGANQGRYRAGNGADPATLNGRPFPGLVHRVRA